MCHRVSRLFPDRFEDCINDTQNSDKILVKQPDLLLCPNSFYIAKRDFGHLALMHSTTISGIDLTLTGTYLDST